MERHGQKAQQSKFETSVVVSADHTQRSFASNQQNPVTYMYSVPLTFLPGVAEVRGIFTDEWMMYIHIVYIHICMCLIHTEIISKVDGWA